MHWTIVWSALDTGRIWLPVLHTSHVHQRPRAARASPERRRLHAAPTHAQHTAHLTVHTAVRLNQVQIQASNRIIQNAIDHYGSTPVPQTNYVRIIPLASRRSLVVTTHTSWSSIFSSIGVMSGRVGPDERPDLLHEPAGVGELGETVEGVDGVRELEYLDRLPLPPQHGAVPPLPVLQRVQPADGHHRRRERLRQLGLRARLARHVRRRVVPVRPLRQERPPRPVGAPHVHHRRHALQPQLRLRALLAAEVRLQEDDAGEADGAVGGSRVRPPLGDVVDDVAPRAVPAEEAAGEVDRDGDVRGEAGGAEVAEHVHAVVVGGRVAVLGREAVVDGDDHGAQLAAEAAAHAVDGRGGRGEQREAAAVEVDEDGEWGRLRCGGVDARPEVPGGVDGDVGGADAVRVRARPRGRLPVAEGEEEAVDGPVAALRDVVGGDEREQLEPHRPRQHRRRGLVAGGRFLVLRRGLHVSLLRC
ncbi:hypothetical protein VPH35_035498 [Triticum aestivum]